MRRHLVVVCGVTAAVLLAGGIAATTAGADTAPDVPGLPALDMPDVPAIPQLPGGVDAAPGQDGAATGQDDALPGQDDALPGQDGALPGQDGAGVPQQAAQQASQQDGGQDDTPHRPGGTTPSTSDGQPVAVADNRGHTADHGRGQADGGGRGNAAGDSRTAGQARPVAQKAATTLAAAQRDVSPASVSTNPAAPVQQQVLSLVNQNRRRGGCDDLSLDRRLIDAAYDHAVDMARRGYFAHESPNGDGAGDRVSEAGYRWRRYGENIARGQESAYEVVDGWMHSPEHRENIMDCRLHQMGIGLAFSPDRTPYWVQDFASPR